jgi:8-oxo-dGTP pyrophosphatase MutT (NUDIX family)
MEGTRDRNGGFRAMMTDPRIQRLRSVLATRVHRRVVRAHHHLEAAVAVVIRPAADLEILFIRRTEREGDPWSGHIAFPGGRRSAADPGLDVTAIRETEEETGITLRGDGALLGPLDEVEPATRHLPPFVIAPFVGVVRPDTIAVPDPREVVHAAWIPLRVLRDPAARSEMIIRRGDVEHRFPSIIWEDYVIWGLTHRVVEQFLEALEPGHPDWRG